MGRLPDRSEIVWFRSKLGSWFKNNRRHFPWRSSSDPYVICVAEILLQQTNASKVANVLPNFTRRFPDWNSLAGASEPEISGAIFTLGLYRRRSHTLHSLANVVVELDSLPQTRRGLENLPGIGQYIASFP